MLKVIDIHHKYQGKPLLEGISFSVENSETVCLLGASGSGKSTLLRIIAGLEKPDRGSILWDKQDLADIPAHKRHFGLMFQDYALFPFLDVSGNIKFGLKMRGMDAEELNERVIEVLNIVELEGFDNRSVEKLSGGEQQRVALARTLAPRPRLLMFDEPLSALDHNLREYLLSVLDRILKNNNVPVIYVTHDQEEAFALADRILLIRDGRIECSGTPQELWETPGSAWTARFLGLGNVLKGRRTADGGVETTHGVFRPQSCQHKQHDSEVNILIRPETSSNKEGTNKINGLVQDVQFTKKGFKVTLQNGLIFFHNKRPELGETICFNLPPNGVTCLG